MNTAKKICESDDQGVVQVQPVSGLLVDDWET